MYRVHYMYYIYAKMPNLTKLNVNCQKFMEKTLTSLDIYRHTSSSELLN